MIKTRIGKLRRRLKQEGLPAILITVPANRFYLSAFTPEDGQAGESSGALLISQDAAFLLTDFRYKLTALAEAVYYEIRLCPAGQAQELAELSRDLGLKKLALEEGGLLFSQWRQLEKNLPGLELVPAGGLVEDLRQIKEGAEIEAIRRSLELMEQALMQTMSQTAAGRSERALALELERAVQDLGGDGLSFPAIVAGGPRGAEPHAQAGGDIISPDSPLVVDVGAAHKKYMSDITRTYLEQGREGFKWKEVYATVRQALETALAGIKPGMSGAQADALARRVIEKKGYGPNFGHSLGHGVGLMVHEAPSLSPRSRQQLLPGMVFTLEPGIYIPGWGGVRLEQMVALEETGCRLLNRLDHFYNE
ncbi:MAG: Xaa-Pro peptidase family protein [Desulfarculales bacterium]|jgi:Xaa-Pro aminopeptidase|nr:Xaa-Pro peptidase family protein [Desulfarculales bacterium]